MLPYLCELEIAVKLCPKWGVERLNNQREDARMFHEFMIARSIKNGYFLAKFLEKIQEIYVTLTFHVVTYISKNNHQIDVLSFHF